jgi:hypothetical protein
MAIMACDQAACHHHMKDRFTELPLPKALLARA